MWVIADLAYGSSYKLYFSQNIETSLFFIILKEIEKFFVL